MDLLMQLVSELEQEIDRCQTSAKSVRDGLIRTQRQYFHTITSDLDDLRLEGLIDMGVA